MWLLIIIAINVNDPTDVPGRVQIQFQDRMSCEQARQTMTGWVKFPWFKVEGRCEKNTNSYR